MRRRDLMRWLAVSGASAATPSIEAQPDDEDVGDEPVDPYFLDPGDLSESERAALIQVETLQQQQLDGRPVVIPRGLKPARAPSYRVVHWTGGIGDRDGRFVSPIAVKPTLGQRRNSRSYRFNCQILGFHGASDDWRGTSEGTLTVELRAALGGQQMTWLFAQQFALDASGLADIGYQYLAQRDGTPEPVTTDEPNLAFRIQLLRSPRRAALLFRRILRIALTLSGVPVGAESADLRTTLQAIPALRVPAMFQEAASLLQAMLGSVGEAAPIWRGAFTPYGIAAGGSQLSLRPGYWLVIDAAREPDLRDVVLEDLGGRIGPVRGGESLDANYLVISCEIDEGPAPSYLRWCSGEGLPQRSDEPQSLAVPRDAPPR